MLKILLVIISIHLSVSTYLWPLPQQITYGGGVCGASLSSFKFQQTGNTSSLLENVFQRYIPLIFYNDITSTKSSSNKKPINTMYEKANMVTSFNVYLTSNDDNLQFGIDESYTLEIDCPTTTLKANNVFGAMYGIEAFSQLVDFADQVGYLISNTPISIQDAPRFPHRGLLIDSSRHFLPLATIGTTIDALSYNKMNTLHWHLTDAESFPVESKSYPMLTEGAWTPQMIYSQDDISQVIQYAYQRGVRVVPEFDTPGHSNSWGTGYNSITTKCPNWSGNINNVNLNPTINLTMQVVEGFMTEMTQLFTDNYFHIGGDEVIYQCWEEDNQITQWMSQNGIDSYNDLMQYYETKLWNIVSEKNGKMLIGWQELFDSYSLSLPSDIIIEVWEDENTLISVAESGYKGILAYGWYLDQLQENWMDFYTFEPFQSDDWTPELESLIVGGESCAWGEQVNFANSDQTIWPRTSATAERLWSARDVNNTATAAPRLVDHICRMNRRGIMSAPILPGYC